MLAKKFKALISAKPSNLEKNLLLQIHTENLRYFIAACYRDYSIDSVPYVCAIVAIQCLTYISIKETER